MGIALAEIHLHGALGERFGHLFRLDVKSPAEAVHALGVQLAGFLAHLSEGAYRVVRGPLRGGEELIEDELCLRIGHAAEIHFVPAMAGAGSSTGLLKAIAGAALVAAAVAFSGGSLAAPLFTVLGSTVTFGNVALLGLGVALAGASALLAQPPTANAGTVDPRSGSLFGNATNTATQNGPVPVICGRFVTTPLLISFGIDAERVSGSDSAGNTWGPGPGPPGHI
jgi:predicted phage tail protein